MKVHEYQAKELMRQFGVPVPEGAVAATRDEACMVAERLGGRVVVKAQVHAGGRGRAGGIKSVVSPSDAGDVAASLLGKRLVTRQTGPEGVPVGKVLVERAADVAHELYVAVLIDRAVGGPVVIASDAGGMEIEEVAAKTPERIHRQVVDPLIGLRTFQARRLAKAIDLTGDTLNAAVGLTQSLYRLFEGKDCSLVEVNPLVVTSDGKLLAVDAKVNIEDYALPRHPELAQMHDPMQEDPLEARAASYNVNYVRLDGQVGCLVNGAGLAMATMDIVRGAGWSPANFLDVGGRADAERVAQATDIILSDPNVKQVLINVFGGILRCDIVAQGVIQAYRSKGSHVPMVVRMLGTNVGEGKRMLAESELPVTFADTLADAVRAVSEVR